MLHQGLQIWRPHGSSHTLSLSTTAAILEDHDNPIIIDEGCEEGAGDKEGTVSSNMCGELVLENTAVDAYEDMDVTIADLPGIFLHTTNDEKSIMVLEGGQANLHDINTTVMQKIYHHRRK